MSESLEFAGLTIERFGDSELSPIVLGRLSAFVIDHSSSNLAWALVAHRLKNNGEVNRQILIEEIVNATRLAGAYASQKGISLSFPRQFEQFSEETKSLISVHFEDISA